MIYAGVSVAEGDARLAFVLGHELAHQHDFWRLDLETRKEFSSARHQERQAPETFVTLLRKQRRKKTELKADHIGFIYAAMAAYPVHTLLQQNSDFFTYWEKHKAAGKASDLSSEERAAHLRRRLQELLKYTLFFEYGARLAYFGWYDDAYEFLERFSRVFPAPETLNNLGYINLQRAVRRLLKIHSYSGRFSRNSSNSAVSVSSQYPEETWQVFHDDQAERDDSAKPARSLPRFIEKIHVSPKLPYCLPVLLDPASRVKALLAPSPDHLTSPIRVRGELDPETEELLETAKRDFSKAAELDPTYIPARINLAVAEFYLNEDDNLSKARRSMEAAYESAAENDDPHLLNLRAVIGYEQGGNTDTWHHALKDLKTLADHKDASACTLYNTAQLLEVRGRKKEAEKYWKRLQVVIAGLPSIMRSVVCEHVSCDKLELTGMEDIERFLASLEMTKISRFLTTAGMPPEVSNWNKPLYNEKISYGTSVSVYRSPQEDIEILSLNGVFKMLVLRGKAIAKPEQLARHCRNPLKKERLYMYNALKCDNRSALVLPADTAANIQSLLFMP